MSSYNECEQNSGKSAEGCCLAITPRVRQKVRHACKIKNKVRHAFVPKFAWFPCESSRAD
jgi:hypothetical protein